MRKLEVEASEGQAVPPVLQGVPETMDKIGPGVPLLVIYSGQIDEEALNLVDDIRVVKVQDIQGDQGADRETDGRAGWAADHDTGHAAEDGGQDGLDRVEEFFLIQLAIPVEGKVICQNAEDQACGQPDADPGCAAGETANRRADGTSDEATTDSREAGDERGHDLLPVEVKPVKQDVLQVELESKVFGEVGHLGIIGFGLRVGLRGSGLGAGGSGLAA